MPLRKRISIAAAAAAAIAVLVAVIACYTVLSGQLRGQIDNQLRSQAALILSRKLSVGQAVPALSPGKGGAAQYTQVVLPTGPLESAVNGGNPGPHAALPDVTLAEQVALRSVGAVLTTVTVDGAQMRMYIFPANVLNPNTGTVSAAAIQLARPIGSVDSVLATMRLILLFLLFLGVGMAAVLGRLAARRVLAPLADVTATAKLIGETEDLSQRLEVGEDDEVGQLAARFNEMLERLAASRDALDASVGAQRQLVADASHELRTPVTSLRTNIEVLLEGGVMSEDDRRRLLTDVVEQCEELSALVSDLIEVARGELPEDSMEDTRLDDLVGEALQRARRYNPGVEFTAQLAPVAMHTHRERFMRAVNNLLDNAAKHNRAGQPVEVALTPSALTVRDHGDGIAPADLPLVFDRFFRGINSRSRQGSGLGLAIVRQVAEQHGGSVVAANAASGGAIFTMRLNGTVLSEPQASGSPAGEPRRASPSMVSDDVVL